ncbi:hypothetical protein [Micromonospora sp. NPDC005305]|uniref:hypothetical protein n=1 Tax=Micromonospora sp. NPDC005305 TaxID=3156875 RepID=UPI0033A881AF
MVLVTAFLIGVAARPIRRERRGQDSQPGLWNPLRNIKKHPRYSIGILSLVLLAGLLALTEALVQLL